MIKSKSGSILGIGEPWKKGVDCEDSRSDEEALDSQGAMTVHLVEGESHRVDCPAQQAPLGRSDF